MPNEDYQQLIDEALYNNDENEFVLSCQMFLDERGFLTEKQMEAIQDIIDRELCDGICYEDITYGD